MKWYLSIFSIFENPLRNIEVVIYNETPKAYLVNFLGVKLWIAKNDCEIVEKNGTSATLRIRKKTLRKYLP